VNLDFSDTEKELKVELRRFLTHVSPRPTVRAVLEGDHAKSWALTRELGKQGWFAVSLPETYGGHGLAATALCAIAEELGRNLAPTSFGSSIFAVAEALVLAGSECQKRTYLPRLGESSLVGALAIAEGEGPLREASIHCVWAEGRLSGAKVAVVDGLEAGVALVAARGADGVRLFLVDLEDPGVLRCPQTSIDSSRPMARLIFNNASAEPLGSGAGWDVLERVLDRVAVFVAFEQVGAADAALEMARQYALSRYAFGQPIGAFQGIKHKLADVWIANELARSNAYYAAFALSTASDDLPLAAATARVAACEALERAARENIQTHGGVAATWSSDCHLFYRRGRHLGGWIGSVQQWRDRAAALVIGQS
jgi:alkylation response protein AidB-like acyl-CoA dehydrogenase